MNTGLIKDLTTYGNDYRNPKERVILSRYSKCPCDAPYESRLISICYDTLGKDYLSLLPFNLYHTPKEIVGTDPYKKIVIQELPEKDDSEVRRTRPRLIISPALSLDDAAEFLDSEQLKLVLAHTYTTSWQKASQEAASPVSDPPAPDTAVETCGDPARSFPVEQPILPEGWSKLSNEWDRWQLRNFCDPTAAYWKNRGPLIRPPVPALGPEIQKKLDELAQRNALRLPHDDPIQGYAGYQPRDSSQIPLEKNNFGVTDVRLSATQAENLRFEKCASFPPECRQAVRQFI